MDPGSRPAWKPPETRDREGGDLPKALDYLMDDARRCAGNLTPAQPSSRIRRSEAIGQIVMSRPRSSCGVKWPMPATALDVSIVLAHPAKNSAAPMAIAPTGMNTQAAPMAPP